VSIKTLHEETASLTFNQLAIESTRRLVQSIKKNECKGRKDFFKPEMVAEEKELRSASHGQLTVFLKDKKLIIVSGCRVKKSGIVWMTMQNGQENSQNCSCLTFLKIVTYSDILIYILVVSSIYKHSA
jgi:hypothetical protein